MPKISTKFDFGKNEPKDKKIPAMDEEMKTARRKVDCKIKSDFWPSK